MAIIRSNGVSADQFDWDPVQKLFVQEISSIDREYRFDPNKRIYDDACDVGFSMINHKTGGVVTFYLSEIEYCDAGKEDIAGWRYKIIPEDIRKNPRLKDVTCLIIND